MKKENSWEERRKHCMKWSVIRNDEFLNIPILMGIICISAWIIPITYVSKFIYFIIIGIATASVYVQTYYENTFYNIIHQRVFTYIGYILQTYEYKELTEKLTTSKKDTKVVVAKIFRGLSPAPPLMLNKGEEAIYLTYGRSHSILLIQPSEEYELEKLLLARKLKSLQKAQFRRLRKESNRKYYCFNKKLIQTLKEGDKIAISYLADSSLIVDIEVLKAPRLEEINAEELLDTLENSKPNYELLEEISIRDRRKRESYLVSIAAGVFFLLLVMLIIAIRIIMT